MWAITLEEYKLRLYKIKFLLDFLWRKINSLEYGFIATRIGFKNSKAFFLLICHYIKILWEFMVLYKIWIWRIPQEHMIEAKFNFMPILHVPYAETFKKHSSIMFVKGPSTAWILGMHCYTRMRSSVKTKMLSLNFFVN